MHTTIVVTELVITVCWILIILLIKLTINSSFCKPGVFLFLPKTRLLAQEYIDVERIFGLSCFHALIFNMLHTNNSICSQNPFGVPCFLRVLVIPRQTVFYKHPNQAVVIQFPDASHNTTHISSRQAKL